ncbi:MULTISPECIES: DUF2997 domain-containing protein [Pandoraea]|uniref:DUF2997 domain-containing protein n=1 Tax=Pandoraea TaxID=93217 RepID=UPI001F5C8848|nr:MULTISPECIES: DUF2997 domain-containing protein [Pandoraea]MCI3208554.1 hypothetical protein [Pandoraea sp. LA3]MDN4586583.1 hypothetical protein [Pandoraea capi]
MAERISIKIAPDGKITSETHGVKGESCLALIATLETLLNANVIESQRTAEYFEQQIVADDVQLDSVSVKNAF